MSWMASTLVATEAPDDNRAEVAEALRLLLLPARRLAALLKWRLIWQASGS